MIIKQILPRVYVNDIITAIAFYEKLTGEKCVSHFKYEQVELEIAQVKDLLIIGGTDEALLPFKATNATFLVDSVKEYRSFLLHNNAKILRDIQKVPTGWNMTIEHADGIIIEYVEHRSNRK